MSRGAHFNRNNGLGGGDRRPVIPLGGERKGPFLAIQCFEQRHHDCTGKDTLMGGAPCECPCHARSEPGSQV